MYLKSLEISGFKSFAKKASLEFTAPITGIVGPNGSGKSNVAEAFRFVLGEQSIKSMRGKRTEDLIWNGSQTVPRANRANVKLAFDNSMQKEGKRLFDKEEFGGKSPIGKDCCLRDGDENISSKTGEPYVGFPGTWYLSANRAESQGPPLILDNRKDPDTGKPRVIKDKRDDALAFVRKQKLSYPILMDPEGNIGLLYGAYATPTVYLIDRKGIVLARQWGPAGWYSPAARNLIKSLVEQ